MLLTGLALALAVVLVAIARIIHKPDVPPADDEFLADFTVDRYRPMARLLDPRDYVFLSAQPTVGPALLRRLRRERRGILRSYLRLLERDFFRLHAALQAFACPAGEMPRRELVRRRLGFQFRLALTRARLSMSACGLARVNPGTVMDPVRLVEDLAARAARS